MPPPAFYRRNTDTSNSNSNSNSNSSSTSARYSDSSDHSHHSNSTAPSSYYGAASRPSLGHFRHQSAAGRLGGYATEASPNCSFDPRESSETYASTVPSYEDLPGDSLDDLSEVADDYIECDAIPSTSSEFAELFPSTRRLKIRHDDSTLDGNMNLRVDTEVAVGGGQRRDVILFHLKMKDLLEREFSLRRYCRDSGREVCHSSRKQIHPQPTPPKRPGLQRSVSSAFASFRGKQEPKFPAGLKRADSGYESMVGEDDDVDMDADAGQRPTPTPAAPQTTSSKVTLEFSNYAHVDVKRRGAKASKRYVFNYWGKEYYWKRMIRKDGESREVSYHLVDENTMQTVAHIVPAPMTPTQAEEEAAKGGWVPPCSLWISDDKILNSGLTDVAE
ncbi:hypothetical protein GP486_008448 [Trichoglossum hirsutum]|uniref:Uncharacterized protein n=1 Tax=Trichoglossum hirsutum TaxID=265104 RepID=A0A9P8IA07_9PEZI|nr:hypothetical protein GP486_008448 [Trichoglossum hirsutum]